MVVDNSFLSIVCPKSDHKPPPLLFRFPSPPFQVSLTVFEVVFHTCSVYELGGRDENSSTSNKNNSPSRIKKVFCLPYFPASVYELYTDSSLRSHPSILRPHTVEVVSSRLGRP